MKHKMSSIFGHTPFLIGFALLLLCLNQLALSNTINSTNLSKNSLEKINFSSMPGDKLQIRLLFKNGAPKPTIFTTESPARIVMDFNALNLDIKHTKQTIGIGNVQSIKAVKVQDQVRVVLDLIALTDYTTQVHGDNLILILNDASPSAKKMANQISINEIDFRRGKDGKGLIFLNFSEKIENINISNKGNKLVVMMKDVNLPSELERRLDVVDFATPVQMIDTLREKNNVKMVIDTHGEYEHYGYEMDNKFTIEIKPLSKQEKEKRLKARFGYTGKKLSLIFQNIEVRAVLQLIADFTGKNMVTSDTVGGNITLRLKNVPWDQALDIILKTKDLGMRQEGNVLRIAPAAEIEKIEQRELESQSVKAKLLPRLREIIQINYRLPSDIIKILENLASEGNPSTTTDTKGTSGSTLSADVKFVGDDKTSKIVVYANKNEILEIRKLINALDLPVKQVMIDARIVKANEEFSRNVGVTWGVNNSRVKSVAAADAVTQSVAGTTLVSQASSVAADGSIIPGFTYSTPTIETQTISSAVSAVEGTSVNNVNLGSVLGTAAKFGIANAVLGENWLLDLELQAAETDGNVTVISSPRVATANGESAMIKQGSQIRGTTTSDQGTEITYTDAVLSLEVTPTITPNNRIQMDIKINNDSPSTSGDGNIDVEELNTNIIVNNGDTIVLGGIFTNNSQNSENKVPLLGDIPVLGYLFKGTEEIESKSELLIFITPRIINSEISVK